MIKAFQALLTGMLATFILDFFFFLGIKLNYIDANKIDLFYNILFADNQNLWIYLFFTILLGYLIIYLDRPKSTAAILAVLFGTVCLGLIPAVGKYVGETLLMQKDRTLYDKRYSYHGDVYYDGREHIYIFDDELQKLLKLPKEELQERPR